MFVAALFHLLHFIPILWMLCFLPLVGWFIGLVCVQDTKSIRWISGKLGARMWNGLKNRSLYVGADLS